ncbi:D-alanine--D-alanine ligase [Thermincola ferriacetica]|uniref:D-alanine--D-alanine ligase n=1 Tax=Thermincola ferriacetica TaxID=281456 RepID=A0A0L6W6Q7_9FIRM|nr:D-alanine--D-alanine ligase [Thermincola ferriacetica]KNZ71058.1 D-alanine--D-alanine ligase [Thermincola ferriacetica]
MKKNRVAVIFGGKSGEHEVSLASANSVLQALNKEKYEIIPIKISREGKWYILSSLNTFDSNIKCEAAILADPTGDNLVNLQEKEPGQIFFTRESVDVVLPVLHGTFGEDGTLQGLLELANIPYVGCGVAASSVGMDKAMMKAMFAQHNLPQGKYLTFLRKEWEKDQDPICNKIETALGYPVFVKPANLGSSVGISKAANRDELVKAMHLACLYDRKVVVEENINGREIEVAVLGNDEPEASIAGEIVPCNDFYDYEAKYISGTSELKIPAPLDDKTMNEVRKLAVKAFKAIDGAGLSRVDFFIKKDTGEILINEINTLPGFTEISMYPKLWAATGLPYDKLLDRLIELAIERHQDKNRNKTVYSE